MAGSWGGRYKAGRSKRGREEFAGDVYADSNNLGREPLPTPLGKQAGPFQCNKTPCRIPIRMSFWMRENKFDFFSAVL